MCFMCIDIVAPGDDGWGEPTTSPIPANRFEKVQRRATAAGMVLGVYLAREDALPGDGERVTLTFVQKGDLEASLDQSLDIVEEELTYWEGLPRG